MAQRLEKVPSRGLNLTSREPDLTKKKSPRIEPNMGKLKNPLDFISLTVFFYRFLSQNRLGGLSYILPKFQRKIYSVLGATLYLYIHWRIQEGEHKRHSLWHIISKF